MTQTTPIEDEGQKEEQKKKTCGIIMPIAGNSTYSKEHWKDVLNIIVEAVSPTDFEARLVSDDLAVGLIHDRIVTNIYNNEIVICDVSSKNPNVMFELGMRLAFDKPTIIIKDDATDYSFDTSPIEHLSYPLSLRFKEIVQFKDDLAKRINATYERFSSDSSYSPFLKSFGKTIVPASLEKTEITESSYIINQLELISKEMRRMRMDNRKHFNNAATQETTTISSRTPLGAAVNEILLDYETTPANISASDLFEFVYTGLRERNIVASSEDIKNLLFPFTSRS